VNEAHESLREQVREVCAGFPDEYWRSLDEKREYPEAFVRAMALSGLLGVLIPEEYGGMGLGLQAACAILEEVNRSGANAGPAHAQMYTMGTLLRHGSNVQKEEYLPKIASSELRLQVFGVSEPEAGTDTTQLTTSAVRHGDKYLINGRKIYISRVGHSDLMVLLARTTPIEEVEKRSHGLSVFIMHPLDLREAVGHGLTVKRRRVMMNNETNELLFENLRIPTCNIIGEEGQGLRYITEGMNAERILIAAECVGDRRFFVERATHRAKKREVFGRPIGHNQGIQFPIARSHVSVEAADLMTKSRHALRLGRDVRGGGEHGEAPGGRRKLGGCQRPGTDIRRLRVRRRVNVERRFRETCPYQVAPISKNLILSYVAEHVLELPRSF
jgi:acyl-CoA dehydrogenase